jgi:hypothetical protein
VFESILGCDSTVVLTLTVNPNYNTTVVESICEGETFTFNGVDYTEEGEYVHNLQTVFGCDSIVTLELTINPAYNETLEISICEGESYNFGTQTLTESGEYTEVFESILGCDSTVNLTLTVIIVDISITTENTTITANAIDAEYQWVDCNNNYEPIPGETGQSFSPTQNGSYAVEVTQFGCTDLSNCIQITTVGFDENTLNDLLVFYPNPNNGEFDIELKSPMVIRLYNVIGDMVYLRHLNAGKNTISIPWLPNGSYIIHAQNESELITGKLIINK